MFFVSIFTPQAEISPCASSADVKDGFAHTKDSASSSSSSSSSRSKKKKKKRDADDHVLLLLLPPPPPPSTFWPGRNFPYLSWKHGGKKEEGVGQKKFLPSLRTDGRRGKESALAYFWGPASPLFASFPPKKRRKKRSSNFLSSSFVFPFLF